MQQFLAKSNNIIKHFAFIYGGPDNITMRCPNPWKFKLNPSLLHKLRASHGYILRDHMNNRTLLNNVMQGPAQHNAYLRQVHQCACLAKGTGDAHPRLIQEAEL